MESLRGNYFLLNNKFIEACQINDFIDSGSLQVYEVLRVTNSCIMFLNDHLERLKLSLIGIGQNLTENLTSDIAFGIKKIIEKNKISEGNIKILMQFSGKKPNTFVYFIPHLYPSETDYLQGVNVGLFESIRKNPNVKATSSARVKINSVLKTKQLYEVLLVDEEEKITEGSRTNVFFIDDQNNVLTAPDDTVLKGITRKYAIQICIERDIPLIFKKIHVAELKNFRSAFLTGTSPKILPIKKIENITFDVNSPVLSRIMEDYEHVLSSCID